MTGNREHSLDRALSHIGLVVIEAPSGFESERFLHDLLDRAGTNEELADSDAVISDTSAAVAVLRAPLRAGLRSWRDAVLERFDRGQPTVLVLPPGVTGDSLIDEPLPTVVIDAAALRETADDVAARLEAECPGLAAVHGVAELIAQMSDGWPTWVSACCSAITDQRLTPEQLIATMGLPPFQRKVVDRHFRRFERSDCDRLAQLAHFDRFSDNAAVALGGVEFAETVLPRAPGLYRSPGGQQQFVEPVRQTLMAEAPLDPAAAEALAPVLVADGDLLGACQALLEGGLPDKAADLVVSLPGRVLDVSDQRELLGVLRVLSDRVGEGPALALKQARVHANLAEIAASVEAAEFALDAADAGDPIRLEASVELLLYRHRSISQEEAADELAELRNEVGSIGPLPTRLREVEAEILGQARDVHLVQAAADRFIEVATEWEYQQESLRAAKALRGLAMGPLWHLGHYREAQQRLDKAARLAIGQTFDYGVTLAFKAFFDARCGDWQALRRSAEQARYVVAESRIRWLGAYVHLASAHEARSREAPAEVVAEFRTARDLLGPLWETDTGVTFACEGAALMAEVGLPADATRLLETVRPRREQNAVEFAIAEVVVLARSGRRDAARSAWEVTAGNETMPNDRRWRAELELARADHLAGLPPSIDPGHIESAAERLGLANLLPALWPEFYASDVGPAALRVEVLGGLRVLEQGAPLDLPEGHVCELVKLLALGNGRASVDAVVHHLWPDADRKLGSRRLKNVLVKARETLGADSLLRGPSTIRFSDAVTTDVSEFEALLAESDAKRLTHPTDARSAAIAALDIYRGQLLPDDAFSDLVEQRRFELRRKADRLLGFLESEHRPSAAWVAAALQRVSAG